MKHDNTDITGCPFFYKKTKIGIEGLIRDIERELLKFKLGVEHADEIIFITDQDGIILYVNPAFEKKYGYKKQEVIGKTPRILNSGKNEESMYYELWKSLKEKNRVKLKLVNKTKDGRLLNIEGSIYSIMDADEKIIGFLTIQLDTTEELKNINLLREQNKKIDESEKYLENIIENIPDMIFVKDAKQLKFVKINSAVEKLLGYERNEFIGKTDFDLFPYKQAKYFTETDKRVLSSNILEDIPEEKIQTRLLGERIIHTKKIPILNEEGKPEYLLGIAEDITEKKKAIEELQANQSLLKNALEMANMGHWEYDASTDTFIFNDQFYKMYHTSFEEIGSYKMSSADYVKRFVHPEDGLFVTEKIKNVTDFTGENIIKELEHRIIYADGNIGNIIVRIDIIRDNNGKIIRTYGVNQDITKRKSTENELIAAKEKAEEMNKLKSNFLAIMSHELRTPLVSILGFSDLLREGQEGLELKKIAETMFRSASRLIETLNLILDLSLIEAEKLNMQTELINIVEEAKEIIDSFEETVRRKGLSLNYIFSQPSIVGYIDRRLLRIILNNLINNGIKFTDIGDVIVTIAYKNNFLEIKVTDTGIGIPKDFHEAIFEEFRQVSEGFSRNFEGTGLGLNITKKIVNKFGGDIKVESELGKGSTFIVKFPFVITSHVKDEREINTKNRLVGTKLSIKKPLALLVDDDPSVLNILQSYLKGRVILEGVKTSSEAIKICNEKKYDFIFMDINLRVGMDGLELTKTIRKLKGYENVPIIATTAYAMKGDKEEFLAAGCSHYLSKPFNHKEITNLVAEILREN